MEYTDISPAAERMLSQYQREEKEKERKRRRPGRPKGSGRKPGPGKPQLEQQVVWKPQYREDGTPGPQVALVTCPYGEILFGGARGGGKACPLYENILTPSGYRKMRDIRVGDAVCGPGGEPTRVTGVYPQGVEDVFRVRLVSGAAVSASADHLWLAATDAGGGILRTSDIAAMLDTGLGVMLPVGDLRHWSAVAAVEPAGRAETQCIRVDRPDGLFVAGDGVVTHNTDGALGAWMEHAARYGAYAKGVFFRRRFKQLEQVQDRCAMLFPKLGAQYHKGDAIWAFPNGATLKLRHLWDEAACEEYQGHSYCVAAGTPILMGDGTYRPVQDVKVGDLVMTLEGPKPVLGTMEPRVSPCVRATVYDASGEFVGEQIHPESHPVLSSVSGRTQSHFGDGPASSPSRQPHVPGEVPGSRPSAGPGPASPDSRSSEPPTDQAPRGSSPSVSQNASQPRKYPPEWQSYTTLLDAHRAGQGSSACPGDGRNDCKESEDGRGEPSRLPRLSCPAVLHAPCPRSGVTSSRTASRSRTSGRSSGRSGRTVQSTSDLPLGQPPPSEPFQSRQGRSMAPTPDGDDACDRLGYRTAQGSRSDCPCDPCSCDDILPGLREDEPDNTQEHTHSASGRYVHPYTCEQRNLSQLTQVGTVFFQVCGPHLVYDLCVADANHYITKNGLVNSNTMIVFEECTNWPTPGPIDKMRATLRSAHGVPTKIILTANPGGSGHSWTKARYVSPAPAGYTPITDPVSGETRIFIPSKLEDNPALFENDPNYERRLLQSGSATLVRAWRLGDWDIVAGGYFDDVFNFDRHVLKPFTIPDSFTWRRSFDWGSAAPASLGIWAVSDGSPVDDLDGFVFPKGSLIRVSEWYTVVRDAYGNVKPNEGLRLTNVALGRGIAERSMTRRFSGCVADTQIFSNFGRESMYSEMQKGAQEVGHALYFQPADKNRVAGWQKMRDMFEHAAKDVPEKPGMWVMENCVHFLRTVPVLQREENNPDEVASEQEDHCVHGDTPVDTDRGPVAIRDLAGTEGLVVSIGGIPKPYRDCRLTRRDAECVAVTTADGRSFTCTPDHRVLTTGGWVEAHRLTGCRIEAAGAPGDPRVVLVVPAGRHDVYDLEVPETHAFAICGGLLIHNCADEARYLAMAGSRTLSVANLTGL